MSKVICNIKSVYCSQALPDIAKFELIISTIDDLIDSNSERRKILKRQVHFYTLFTTIFDLTLDGATLSSKQVNNYRSFIDNYENDGLLERYFPNMLSEIYKYKSLSKEGTRQKSNRMERHNCLKKVFNYSALEQVA